MTACARNLQLLSIVLALAACATSRAERESAERSAAIARSGPWLQFADVRQAGFDDQRLRAACERADKLRSGALMAVFRGRVILACGDLERPFERTR
jgi:hypothetical protein